MLSERISFLKAFHGVDPHLDIGRFGPENLFDEEDKIVIDLAGQMELEKVSEEVKKSVEKKLVKICKDLLLIWDERQSETELQKASIKAFGKVVVMDAEQDTLGEHYKVCSDLLKEVVDHIPGTHCERFMPAEMVDGYVAWNRYWNESDQDVPVDKQWILWRVWPNQWEVL